MAIAVQSGVAQSIAVGNLGLVAMGQGDLQTARACLEQHIELVKAQRDHAAETSACQILGVVAQKQGEHTQAMRLLNEARELSKVREDSIHNDESPYEQCLTYYSSIHNDFHND